MNPLAAWMTVNEPEFASAQRLIIATIALTTSWVGDFPSFANMPKPIS
jgi:hypothetical protein